MQLQYYTLEKLKEAFGDYEIQLTGTNIILKFGYWELVNLNRLNDILPRGIEAKVTDDLDDNGDESWYRYSYELHSI